MGSIKIVFSSSIKIKMKKIILIIFMWYWTCTVNVVGVKKKKKKLLMRRNFKQLIKVHLLGLKTKEQGKEAIQWKASVIAEVSEWPDWFKLIERSH